jgi:hypothetical protein
MLGVVALSVALAWPGLVVGSDPRARPAATAAAAVAGQEAYEPQPRDVVTIGDWPAFGRWMLDRHLRPASWLGTLYLGRTLREPINVVIVDPVASSAADAVARLFRVCKAAGYEVREGHSGGYRAYIGGALYTQLPDGRGKAFANRPFELHNNHGRIFGPVRVKDGWLFIGAVSREKLVAFTKAEHQFMSFAQARDHFSRRLDRATDYKIAGVVNLGNAVVSDPAVTTADHDGKAVLLRAQR